VKAFTATGPGDTRSRRLDRRDVVVVANGANAGILSSSLSVAALLALTSDIRRCSAADVTPLFVQISVSDDDDEDGGGGGGGGHQQRCGSMKHPACAPTTPRGIGYGQVTAR